MRFMKIILIVQVFVLTGLATSSRAAAQSAQIPAPKQERPVVIVHATVHPVPGEVIEAPAYIVFENGNITAIGSGEAPMVEGARVIEAQGMHVYPGLISCDTALGLTETGDVDVTHDMRELGEFTPEVRAAIAVNPDSDLIPVTRASGILLALTFPQGGLISGRCSIIRLDGWTWEDMAVRTEAGVVINWPRTEPIVAPWMQTSEAEQMKRIRENLDRIEQFFVDAETYIKAKDADPSMETDLRFEALRSTLAGETPLFVRANSAGQIESAVAWSIERGIRPIIVGATDCDDAIPLLVKHDVPVIVGGTHRLPSRRHDPYDSAYTLPSRLHEGGVRFAIASGAETPHERHLAHVAATASAYGLPPAEALRAVTQRAAEILGIGDRYGTLEAGKSATLIVTTGDPLEITSDVFMGFIDGRLLDLTSRHTRLNEKYREKYRQLGLME